MSYASVCLCGPRAAPGGGGRVGLARGWPGGRGDAGALAGPEEIEAGLTVAGEGGAVAVRRTA